MIAEVHSGKVCEKQIPVEVKIDSQTLLNCINTTEQVEDKTIHWIISWIKQQKKKKRLLVKLTGYPITTTCWCFYQGKWNHRSNLASCVKRKVYALSSWKGLLCADIGMWTSYQLSICQLGNRLTSNLHLSEQKFRALMLLRSFL